MKTNYDYVNERFERNKTRALAILGGRCNECSSTERLEFDHINNDRKTYKNQISVMLRNNSWSKIEAELAKCQLLCKSCHQRKSLAARGYKVELEHGDYSMYNKRGCRCSRCRRAAADYARMRNRNMTPEQRKKHLARRREYRNSLLDKT